MATPTVRNLDLKGKRVLIRVDFNVPVDKQGNITDDSRIQAAIPTIEYVIKNGGTAILMSHFGRPKAKMPEYSLQPCAERLSQLLGKSVVMAPDCIGKQVEELCQKSRPGDVIVLENLRFYPAEEKPELDPSFAKNLAKLGDQYVNDAFGSAHRAHSSVVTIVQYFPKNAAIGFLIEKEIAFLGNALKNPKRPFFAIIGGAKVSTKIGVLRTLLSKVDALFIGGAMAYTFMKADGILIGKSLFEPEFVETAKALMAECKQKKIPLYLPIDIVAATAIDENAPSQVFEGAIGTDFEGLDIGPKTIDLWTKALVQAKTVLWNGPVGVFEIKKFAVGTEAIALCLAHLKDAITIAGGGETAASIQQLDLENAFTHISTGGGASLEYIEKGALPGITIIDSTLAK
ncbi:MAG TPA: phosphoglycerate kinase [Chlamydiales bacterium]|nr:phosphoglycerate kinase [Chlamydiales bacterium]